MSVDLTKNRDQLVAAWKSVLDDKSPTDWALFGYEPQTNDLRCVGTGDGGLAELNEELNTSNIMYGFVRVQDPKTSLTKYVLINWQGEGTPTVRKGTCANHIRDVAKLFAGAHCTINARNEDEMEPELIVQKVSSVGSAYSFKEPRMQHEEQRGPIGTNYARVIPGREINSRDRDDFWKREEAEERRRVDAERERLDADRERGERERKARDEAEHREREARVVAAEAKASAESSPVREPTPAANALGTNSTSGSNGGGPKTMPQPLTTAQLSPVRSATVADEMRQQRNNEAKALIGSRVGTAKAMFTQHSASGQLNSSPNSKSLADSSNGSNIANATGSSQQHSNVGRGAAPPAKPARNSIAQRIKSFNNAASPVKYPGTTATSAAATPPSERQSESPVPVAKTNIPNAVPEEAFEEPQKQSVADETSPENGHTAATKTATIQPPQETQPSTTFVEQSFITPTPPPPATYEDESVGDQYSTIKRSPYTKQNSNASSNSLVATPVDAEPPPSVLSAEPIVPVEASKKTGANGGGGGDGMSMSDASRGVVIKNDMASDNDIIYQDIMKDVGLRARALYDYQAADDSEITFDPGDTITHIDQIDEGWWQGLGPDGSYGLFPANYVELI